MSFEIQEALRHLEATLGRVERDGVETSFPSMVTDTIQAVAEARGWDGLKDPDTFDVTSAANVQLVRAPQVPEGESHLVIAVHAFHSDGVANHTIRIDLEDQDKALTVSFQQAVSVPQFHVVALPRPVLVQSGQNLRVSSIDLVGLGNTLSIQGFFARLAVGEYVPGGPYG